MGVGVTSFRSTDIHKDVDKTVECAQRVTFTEDNLDLFNLCESCLTNYVDILCQIIWCAVLTRRIISSFWKVYVYKSK